MISQQIPKIIKQKNFLELCNLSNEDMISNTALHITHLLCNLYQYSQLIQVPTRVTASSSTLIDLFLTNNPCKFSHHGVSHIGISDHSLIYAIRKSFTSTGVPTIINSRQLRNFDPTMFRRDLALAPWQSVENITDPNVAWNAWRNMFLNICDSHAPFRRKKVRSSNSPWLTPDLKKLRYSWRLICIFFSNIYMHQIGQNTDPKLIIFSHLEGYCMYFL